MFRHQPVMALFALIALTFAGCAAPAPATPAPTPTEASSPSPAPSPSPTLSPSPSPSPAPSPSPTPAGIDVVEEFLRQITARQSVEATLSGDMLIGQAFLGIGGEFSATATGDSLTVLETVLPDGRTQLTETLAVGGRSYTAIDGGPFVEEEVDRDQASLAEFLRTLARLEDEGSETIDGQTLHRLVTPPDVTVDPAILGFTDPAFEDVSVAVEFYSQPDGTPELMIATAEWTHRVGDQTAPGSMTYAINFDRFGGSVEVSAPDVAWHRFESEHGVSIGYPEDWAVTPASPTEPYDAIDSPYGDRLLIASEPGPGNLEDATDEFLAGFNETFPVAIGDVEEATIAGQPALLVSMTPEVGDARVYAATTMGERFVALVLIYPEDPATEGLDLLRAFLTTVRLTD
ncbi:MAG TPA: hypothetical protein VM305_01410 [Candidatus Limnocylindrales bacterium]|nr:hypothetical protein [Candidatus Limnocylindrales bacterium]